MNDIIQKMDASNSEIELCSICQEFIETCGYEFFSVFTHPEEYNRSLYEIMQVSNWPISLVKSYDRSELITDSPFSSHEKKMPKPFLWTSKEMYNSQDEEKESIGSTLFANSEMSRGVVFAVQSGNGADGFVVFTSNKDLKNEADFDQIHNFANVLFEKSLEISSQFTKNESRLSKREHECLIWTSEGKTSYEIGMILGLSENTINNYLVTVGRKLGAVNRPHMVGIALRRGYIS